jgi:hypothetical protein
MNEATNALGAAMRMAVTGSGAAGGCTREVGTLFLHLTRYGNEWALELCDETPIDPATMDTWRKAVEAPVFGTWRTEAHGKVARFEWQGTEDAAPAGSKATWIGGAFTQTER